jgi:methylase of polypeptide subunit release factors
MGATDKTAPVSAALVIDPPRIRRLRATLDELGYDRLQRALRGSFPRVPHPPFAEFTTTLRCVDPKLRPWFKLLLLGRPVPTREAELSLEGALEDLLQLGVLELRDGRVWPRGLTLCSFFDRYLLARRDPSYPRTSQPVLDVYIGPSSYRLAYELPLGRRFDRVLDLCAGSGLIGILMAPSAGAVVSTDLAADAVAAARFNCVLNGVESKVEVRRGDLFEPVAGERFDLIAFNAPFVSVPPDLEVSALIGGGPDGMALLRPLLAELRRHLTGRGWALAYLEGEGDSAGPFLATRMAPSLRTGGVDAELTLVDRITVSERLSQLREMHRLRRAGLPKAWAPFYRDQGARYYYAMVARFRPGRGRLVTINAIPRR